MASVLVSEADPDVRRLLVLVIERLGHEAIVLDGTVEVPSRASLLLLELTSSACLEQARRARAGCPDVASRRRCRAQPRRTPGAAPARATSRLRG